MKSTRLLIALILFTVTAAAQDNLPIIKSNVSSIDIKDGEVLKKNGWTLTPEAKPDVYEAALINGNPHKVTFSTDVDSISFMVEEGKKYDFIIQWGDKLCYQQIVGIRFVPAAVFDKKYQAVHKGKTFIEIPEVYELVNIAIAMTPTGIADKNLVYQETDYYKKMRQWFDKYQNHPVLSALNTELKKNPNNYFTLKMDAYSFEFDKRNKINKSKIYDRISWGRSNTLQPFLAQLQSFSEETNFRRFYKENRKIYDEQIAFYRDAANIAEMIKWLDKNFPKSNAYASYKVIFSPLVASNQSANWFESNGFNELQAHVNFPYPFKNNEFSEKSLIMSRGNIVFTELNHGYINPEGDKYADRIVKAISNRDRWVDKKMGSGYYRGGISAFNEYMNWGLVSLRFVDYAPRDEQDKMIAGINHMMTKVRGFPQFEAFDKFLVDLYRTRKPNQTIADLYPQIIQWFEKNN